MREYLKAKQDEDRREEAKRNNRMYGVLLSVVLIGFWCFCAAGISGVF